MKWFNRKEKEKLFEQVIMVHDYENDKYNEQDIIINSYDEYLSCDDKDSMARQIARNDIGNINNSCGELNEWLDVFKDEHLVMYEILKKYLGK